MGIGPANYIPDSINGPSRRSERLRLGTVFPPRSRCPPQKLYDEFPQPQVAGAAARGISVEEYRQGSRARHGFPGNPIAGPIATKAAIKRA